MEKSKSSKIHIAYVGCTHGKLDAIYQQTKEYEEKMKVTVSFIVCCGDFEAVRNQEDLVYKVCPPRYKKLGNFAEYYSGKKVAPYVTIFIGGNHEASNYMEENYYGGWVCKNIFYLGKSGVISIKGIRIAGLSGIYGKTSYFQGHYEKDLLKNLHSIYMIREFETAKLAQIKQPIDIFLSHDWPTSVVAKKDVDVLLKIRPDWTEQLNNDQICSPAGRYLLNTLQPTYWFSGHMHVVYSNTIVHSTDPPKETKFCALDKLTAIKERKFIDFIELDRDVQENLLDDSNIYLDPEWLGITKTMNKYIPFEKIDYDMTAFFNQKEFYIKCFTSSEFPVPKERKLIVPEKDFESTLQKNIDQFKVKIQWNYQLYPEQRAFILKVLGMPDCVHHKIDEASLEKKNVEEDKKIAKDDTEEEKNN